VQSKLITIYRYTAETIYEFNARHNGNKYSPEFRPLLFRAPTPASSYVSPESGEGYAHVKDEWQIGQNDGKGWWHDVAWTHTGQVFQGQNGVVLFQWQAQVLSYSEPQQPKVGG
jgi:hypothetical protein